MSIDEQIKAVIEKNLPAEVGSLLQKRLAEGEEAIQQLKVKDLRITELKRSHDQLEAENINWKRKIGDQEKREEEFQSFKQQVVEWKVGVEQERLQMEKGKTKFLEETIRLLLGNRVIRETINDHMVVGNGQQLDYGTHPPTARQNSDSTIPVTKQTLTELA